jgi:L-ascorbate metabolism protein UlaG (beta-lactamase superfamily)
LFVIPPALKEKRRYSLFGRREPAYHKLELFDGKELKMNLRRTLCMGSMALMISATLTTVARAAQPPSEKKFEEDTLKVDGNDLKITFIGHATLMFAYQGKIVHVDPVASMADYSKLPRADVILVTHEHGDHLDPKAIGLIRKEQTTILLTKLCADKLGSGTVMKNGDVQTVAGLKVEAVPAYNISSSFHPKGTGNGYVITFGKARVYVAGDTENIPEMKALKNIDVAFLPMNLPYTMTPEMVADAAKMIQPKILYPYHYSQTDPNALVKLLKDTKIEVRVRKMQ